MLSEKEFLYQLGVNFREKREEKGYKTINAFCSKLAEYELNISDSMFGKYELGTQKISVYRLGIVAKALDVNISELYPAMNTDSEQ